MLVVTRKPDQSIMIGDDIEISVLDVKGENVRIGISAPRQTPIWRNELYEAQQRDREQTTRSAKVKASS